MITCEKDSDDPLGPSLCDFGYIQKQGFNKYEGHFRESRPELVPAGALTGKSITVADCLQTIPRSPSPDIIRRYDAHYAPRQGKARVLMGKAFDPEQLLTKDMTHGKPTLRGDPTMAKLINPTRKTGFEQHLINQKESVYASYKHRGGHVPDPGKNLPSHIDPEKYTFVGRWNERDGSAGQLINPYKTYERVHSEAEAGHDLYKRTHNDYDVGEKSSRNYLTSNFNPKKVFGIETPHDRTGRNARKSVEQIHLTETLKYANIVSKCQDDVAERTCYQVAKTLDPIRDTLNVPPNHTFGLKLKREPYGVGDLLHRREEENFLRGKDKERWALGFIRNHLKKVIFYNFDTIMEAFQFYDKCKVGKIDINALREVCVQFNIPVSRKYLEKLMEICDVDKDGYIDFTEFSNFLTFKDSMPSGLPLTGASADDLKIVDGNPVRLKNQIDLPATNQKTSASLINAVFDGTKQDFRKYGVPSIRSDLPAPFILKFGDPINYGDQLDVWGLINPSVYSTYGVTERDFFVPRSKEELCEIFANIGVKMDCQTQTFDCLYDLAAKQSPKGNVSVDSFRSVLDQCHEAVVEKSLGPIVHCS